jgi:hypothetical protein
VSVILRGRFSQRYSRQRRWRREGNAAENDRSDAGTQKPGVSADASLRQGEELESDDIGRGHLWLVVTVRGATAQRDAPVVRLTKSQQMPIALGGLGSYGVSLGRQQRDQLVGHQLEMSERPVMPDPRNPIPEGQLVKRAVLA